MAKIRIIAGLARGRQLKTRKGMDTRPTADRVKESLFNIIADIIPNCRFLDVFAGNGGVGIEALSRGAIKSVFIENNQHCVKIIKDNLKVTDFLERGTIIHCHAITALCSLQNKGETFNLIFLDPPYHSPELSKALETMASGIIECGGLVIVEHHSKDVSWRDDSAWQIIREKKYGDTTLTFLVPIAAGGE